ncbi:uncharacterized protein PRCAT00001254001 [Priceomyces carsonii]|uniref:uncharacterized protein n=1 Tax=Priceomyces carsonii TaxID=28549 RepID=UPI002EDB5F70|nr:unnamed protein product [Priceomyces carsonii]
MSNISYLIVYNSHNGNFIRIPKPIRYHKLLHFKEYLAESFGIDTIECIFLLTSFGIKLDFNLINELNDVYFFDKRLFSNNFDRSILEGYLKDETEEQEPRTSMLIGDGRLSVKAMTNNLKSNKEWAISQLKSSATTSERRKTILKQINVIFKSLNIIFQFGTNFINEIEKSYNNYYQYINLLSSKSLHKSWMQHLETLSKFPSPNISNTSFRLVDFLDVHLLQESAKLIEEHLPFIVKRFNDMGSTINMINGEKLQIDQQIKSLRDQSINAFKNDDDTSLMVDIERASDIIAGDIEKLFLNAPISLDETYRQHKDRYSPIISKVSLDIFESYKKLKQFKSKTISGSLQIFNSIAKLQMHMVEIKSELKSLSSPNIKDGAFSYEMINQIKKSEDYLSLTIDLPLLFGFLLIEKRRQFEWYDFYSKGIVSNISEQLTIMIDQERLFRKVWLKKVGSFLALIGARTTSPSLPSIDITLIGNKGDDLSLLENVQVEREDITSYIQMVSDSDCPSPFSELLDTNFKDLMKSTNNMKKITKIVSALSTFMSFSNDDKRNQKGDEDLDLELNVTKGLRSRIRKLENLLHQQQYKNLSKWPVTRNNLSISAQNKTSMMIEHPSIGDPKVLLPKRSSSLTVNSSGQPKVLDTANIDKHIENIRLKKENSELKVQNEKLLEDSKLKEELIEKLRSEITRAKTTNDSDRAQLEKEILKRDEELQTAKLDSKLNLKEIENLNKKMEHRTIEVSELRSKLAKFSDSTSSSDKVSELKEVIDSLRSELDEVKNMKNDLLSNLSSKEIEVIKERNNLENEIKTLQSNLEETTENYEALIELTAAKQKQTEAVTNDLNNTIVSLFKSVKRLMDANFEFIVEFCLVLESMGLLLIMKDDVLKITRVKGLRSKNANIEGEGFEPMSSKPNSKFINEISDNMSWSTEMSSVFPLVSEDSARSLSNQEEDTSRFIEESMKLISIFNNNFKLEGSPFDKYLRITNFKDNVQMQEDSDYSSKFFLNAISKRFKDVEGYAKRQTKENKMRIQEVNRLSLKLNSKISMNHFQKNDLVLFLPTRIDMNDDIPENPPWAAFNIGAPHYFLKAENLDAFKDKDWMLGRVRNIEEQQVTDDNVNDVKLNPFKLSTGISWYMVEAKEDLIP